jgi:hypothetical protein
VRAIRRGKVKLDRCRVGAGARRRRAATPQRGARRRRAATPQRCDLRRVRAVVLAETVRTGACKRTATGHGGGWRRHLPFFSLQRGPVKATTSSRSAAATPNQASSRSAWTRRRGGGPMRSRAIPTTRRGRRRVRPPSPRRRRARATGRRPRTERKGEGEELAPAMEATTTGKGSRHCRRGSFEISAEGEGGRGALATCAGSRRGRARGRTRPPKVGKRRARCCSAMPAGEEGPPGTARREEPSGAMARGSQASASASRSRRGPCWRSHAGGVGEGATPEVGERAAPVGSSYAGGGAARGWMG